MIRRSLAAGIVGIASLLSGVASAEEPIVGNWKTASGDTAVIASCAAGYCITLKTGKFAGREIGKLSGKGGSYSGEITDPANDKTYDGTGTVSENALKMQGCVMKVFCKSQTWTRL